jgi:multidrug transporter EmrE-like cation transporter
MSLAQIVGLSLTEIVGDFGYKWFANEGGFVPFAIGTAGYIGVVTMLIVSLQNSSVLMVNGAWDGISAVIESVAAYLFLGERLESSLQYFGLFLIIIGLFFLKIPLHKKQPFVWPSLFTAKIGTLSNSKVG